MADELRNMSSKAQDLQSWAKREIQRIILQMNDKYELKLQQNSIASSQKPNADCSEGNLAQYYETLSPTYFTM